MRRDQHIEAEFTLAVEPALDDQHVAPRVGGDAQAQLVARMPMHDLDRRHAGRQEPQ